MKEDLYAGKMTVDEHEQRLIKGANGLVEACDAIRDGANEFNVGSKKHYIVDASAYDYLQHYRNMIGMSLYGLKLRSLAEWMGNEVDLPKNITFVVKLTRKEDCQVTVEAASQDDAVRIVEEMLDESNPLLDWSVSDEEIIDIREEKEIKDER